MSVKEFLKPEWKKFILPIVLTIIFFFTTSVFYSLGSIMDKYGCEMVLLIEEQLTNMEKNDTLAFNQTAEKGRLLFQNMQTDTEQIQVHFESIEPVIHSISTIDPIFPVPCETISEIQGNVCEFYMSEETYNCFESFVSEDSGVMMDIFGETEKIEYKKASAITLGLNVLLLFVEGYLISSAILFIYRKIRKK